MQQTHLHRVDDVTDLDDRVACEIAPVLRHREARLLESIAQRCHLHRGKFMLLMPYAMRDKPTSYVLFTAHSSSNKVQSTTSGCDTEKHRTLRRMHLHVHLHHERLQTADPGSALRQRCRIRLCTEHTCQLVAQGRDMAF